MKRSTTEDQIRRENAALIEHLKDYFENEWSKSNQRAVAGKIYTDDLHVSFEMAMQVNGRVRHFKIEVS